VYPQVVPRIRVAQLRQALNELVLRADPLHLTGEGLYVAL